MSQMIKLTDPNAGALVAIAEGGVDVTMRVTMKDLEWSWEKLGAIMDQEASSRRTDWEANGNTEDELRLLCGLFAAVTRTLPMTTANYIEWMRLIGPDSLDDFAAWRLGQMDDDRLRDSLAYVLNGRNLDSLGLERIDEPVSEVRKRRGTRSARASKKAT